MNKDTYCRKCWLRLRKLAPLTCYERADGAAYHCSFCGDFIYAERFDTVMPEQDYSLTQDELRYTIHSLQKQLAKVGNARAQLITTITKLEIMLELAKEKEVK
ncbi:hypothetical protein [Geobacter sp. SVR]|uniref:hypothetical protein n=1 Tax=Geobacter sp. SVR TaxID=2495594 RepID=UPI00143F00E4|nr:hypothetical protein [Geobacter sp. SVR]BCS54078.1 hypothetical protein GSVR_23860 [Geobacter sp. SVR]GCF87561.1 hypothetical protein GSbR_41610 [Geobacter sp. SVR]